MTKFLLLNPQEIEDGKKASTKRKENEPKDTSSQTKKAKVVHPNRLATKDEKPQQSLHNYFPKKQQSGWESLEAKPFNPLNICEKNASPYICKGWGRHKKGIQPMYI